MNGAGPLLLAYLGPETAVPVASALAAIVGTLLICWRLLVRVGRAAFRCLFRKRPPPGANEQTPAHP